MNISEDILIGTWLSGERLEDLVHVNPASFKYSDVVRDLKSGMPSIEVLMKHKRDRAELVRFTQMYSPVLYQVAYKQLLEEQIRQDIRNEADLDIIRAKLDYLDRITVGSIQSFTNYGASFADEIQRRANQELIRWKDMPSLQEMTNGLKRGELTAIAARPSVGKSAFALQIGYGAWEQGVKVLYFPLEMSAVQTFGRILVRKGYEDPKEVQIGKITNQDRHMLGIDHLNEIEKSGRFLIYEGEGRIENIEQIIDQEKPYLVVIDQLTQMKASKQFKDIRSQFSYMTSNLKRIAMQYNVSVALLCQINRSADNAKPTMANLKESGSIEEDSDNVVMLHRLRPEDLKAEGYDISGIDFNKIRPMEINLAKQRDGEIGTFEAKFRPEKMQFYEEYKR